MSRRDEYAPKHLGPEAEPALRKGLRKSLVLSGVAVVTTALAVSTGILAGDDAGRHDATLTSAQPSAGPSAKSLESFRSDLAARERSASRSDRRTDAAKNLSLSQKSGGQAKRTKDLTQGDPRNIARAMLPEFGFAASEFSCLDALYMSESGWDPHADNPTSTAYGIPQALTGGTHDNLPADYMTNPASQIRWGLKYIKDSYGTPCAAWSFKQGNNWY